MSEGGSKLPSEKSIRALTIAVWFVAFGLLANFALSLFPVLFPDKYLERFSNSSAGYPSETSANSPITHSEHFSDTILEVPVGPQFHELTPEEQIERATVIARLEYEQGPDGKMRAIFREFLKKNEGVTFYYELGDEYPSSSYYPKEGTRHGDGTIAFFVGSPAEMRLSMSYFGDRITSLGDMPLELFRSKCAEIDDA